MNKKSKEKLEARAKKLQKAIQKETPRVIWDMVAELIEIELELTK
jgi:hypothetical protein